MWLPKKYIGDAVMASALVDGLHARYERVTVFGGPVTREVLLDRACFLDFAESRRLRSLRAMAEEARRLRGFRLDAIALVVKSFRVALVARLAGIPIRCGGSSDGRGFLLSHPVPDPPDLKEWHLMNLIGERLTGRDQGCSPWVTCCCEEIEAAKARLGGCDYAINAGASYRAKEVPAQALLEAAQFLKSRGRRIVWLGREKDRARFEELAGAGAAVDGDLVGRTSLRELMGVLSVVPRLLSADGGMVHLAAAMGCGTITPHGPSKWRKWGYTEPPHQTLVAPKEMMERLPSSAILEALERDLDGPGYRAEPLKPCQAARSAT